MSTQPAAAPYSPTTTSGGYFKPSVLICRRSRGWYTIKAPGTSPLQRRSDRSAGRERLPGELRVPLSANGSLGSFLFVTCGQSAHSLWVDGLYGWPDADDEAWLGPFGCFPKSSCSLFCNHLTAAALEGGLRMSPYSASSLFKACFPVTKAIQPHFSKTHVLLPGSFYGCIWYMYTNNSNF